MPDVRLPHFGRHDPKPHLPPLLAAALAALLVGIVVWNGRVDYTDSDPLGTLLVTESILRHGTIDLEAYGPGLARYGPRIGRIGGRAFYTFPLGSSLFAIPWVAAENALGTAMRTGERAAQIRLAAVLAAILCFLGWEVGRAYVGQWAAVALALLFSLGTPFASTVGTALWSHDFAVLFMLLAVLHLVRQDTGRLHRISPGWLAAMLFSAYLCRPTASVFVVCVLLCVALADRRGAVATAVGVAGFLAAFSAFSYAEFGRWLPPYYEPQRLAYHPMFWVAVETNLFGPNRGLFVYSPFLALLGLGFVWGGRALCTNRMMIVGGIFPVLTLLVISSLPKWWAGGCFGPRYMVDAVPGLLLASALAWREVATRSRGHLRRAILAAALALLGAFSIWINTYQALYNRYTRWWNRFPGATPNAVLDWRYPQLLFDRARFEQAKRDIEPYVEAAGLPEVPFGRVVSFADDDQAFFDGWSYREVDRRWSTGRRARILLRLPSHAANRPSYRLELRAATLGLQRVEISWNGHALGERMVDLREFGPLEWVLPAKMLRPGKLNEIRFSLPDAKRAPSPDPRTLAIALASLVIVPE